MLYLPAMPALQSALARSHYTLLAHLSDGVQTTLHLSRGRRRLRALVTPDGHLVQLSVRPALPRTHKEALSRDLGTVLQRSPGALQRLADAARVELDRRAASSAWTALNAMASGQPGAPCPLVSCRPGHPCITPDAIVALIHAVRASDAPRVADLRFHLATDPLLDARVLAATHVLVGDASSAARFRALPGRPTAESWWRWLQGTAAPGPECVHPSDLPLADRVALMARATWWWGGPHPEHPPAYGHPTCPPVPAPAVEPAPAGLVESFLRDGYVALRGAVPPDTVEAWIRSVLGHAHRHDAHLPEHTPFAASFDPVHPTFVRFGTLRWTPGHRLPLHLVAPPLASAAHALIGLPRLHARLSNALLCTRTRGQTFQGAMDYDWHLDQTPERGHLGNQTLALLALVLLTDVGPEDGPTIFLPESPRFVARSLAEAPGQDQDDRTWTRQLGARCDKKVRVIGQKGDIFLMHPLTLHTRDNTTRDGNRIISNVNIFARAPLDYRSGTSAVERYPGLT